MRIFSLILLSLFVQGCASSGKVTETVVEKNITEQAVDYKVNEVTHKGFIAAPKDLGKKPAVIVVHEWWGHNDYARSRASQLAEQGYVAMSLDMYGDGKIANHPKDAGEFSNATMKDPAEAEKKFRAALEVLKARPDVDGDNIVAIGYCFGGAVVIDMIKRGVPLKGGVAIHGMLNTPSKAKTGKVKAKLLLLNGEADQFVTQKNRDAVKKEMKTAKINFEMVDYPGAKHAFSNPQATENGKKFGIPLEYNREADTASWEKTLLFLKQTFALPEKK